MNGSTAHSPGTTLRMIITAILVIPLTLGTVSPAMAAGPATVNLGAAGSFAILTKTGITNVPTSAITGDMGASPIDSTAITGFALTLDSTNTFSTSPQVTGKIYAADYADPTPANLTTAVLNMEAAYTDAAGRTLPDATELYAGVLDSQTITPGLYKWSTGVSLGITTAGTDVTLSGSATDVWIFQIAGDLTIGSGSQVLMSGGALPANVFWQVGGGTGVEIGTGAHVEGNILALKAIHLRTGATLNGRALSQTAVTLDMNTVVSPAGGSVSADNYLLVPGDYDGDGSTDPGLFEKATGNWFAVGSTAGFMTPALNFGNATSYIPVQGDYDGDGATDAALFEKATGNWFVVGSTDGFFSPALNFGNDTNYIPVPGDYDGDLTTDPGVFEKATGNWFAVGSTAGFMVPALNFGNATGYIPVQGDYDGDGETDAAVFEKATGNWFVVGSTDGFFAPALGFGNDTSYIPVQGDYDGDLSTDPAVFEKATGNWFVVGSTDGFFAPALNFGNAAGYVPVQGDYDGDLSTDPAVFEKATGNWFVVGSTDGFFTPALGFPTVT